MLPVWMASVRAHSLLPGDILAGKGSTFPSSQGGDDELPGYFYICFLYDLIRLVRWRCNTVWCSVTLQMYLLQLLALLTSCHVKNFRESLLSLPVLCVPEHLAELFGKQVWIRRGYLVNQSYFKLWPENLRSYVARTGAISKEMITRGTWSARKLRVSQFLSSLSLCCCVKLFLLKGMASVLRKAKTMVHACGSTGQGASHPPILTEQVDLQISAQEKSWKLWPLNVMAQHRFSQNNSGFRVPVRSSCSCCSVWYLLLLSCLPFWGTGQVLQSMTWRWLCSNALCLLLPPPTGEWLSCLLMS